MSHQAEYLALLKAAREQAVIPPGWAGLHIQSNTAYRENQRIARRHRAGSVLVFRPESTIQLPDLQVARRDPQGPVVYHVWASLRVAATDPAALAGQVDPEKGLLIEELEQRARSAVRAALESNDQLNIASDAGQRFFARQIHEQAIGVPGVGVIHCVLRRVLKDEEYLAEQQRKARYCLELQRVANDQRLAQAGESGRLDEALGELERQTLLRHFLTQQEVSQAANQRLATYLELFSGSRGSGSPCPHPDCRLGLEQGQTFTCAACGSMMHAWHRSGSNPRLCDRCAQAARRRALRAIIAGAAMVAGGGVAFVIARALPPSPSLQLLFYAFGQRASGGDWSEFLVRDGASIQTGDQIRVCFSPTSDAYVYLFCQNSDGTVVQLFPHPAIQKSALCQANTQNTVPDGINWYTLDHRPGAETIYLVASAGPQPELESLIVQIARGPSDSQARGALARRMEDLARSARTTRGLTIEPDRRIASVRLHDGRRIDRVMEEFRGRGLVVHRIQLQHVTLTQP